MSVASINVPDDARQAARLRMDGGGEAGPPPAAIAIERAVVDTLTLAAMDCPPKEKILGDFFEVGDFGFIYAPRGLGKTWLSLAMADAAARGGGIGEWEAGARGRNVLIVDGEMSLAETKSRAAAIGMASEVRWFHHEHLFEQQEKVINLSDPEQQDALFSFCREAGIEVLILDNLSCLFSGVRENDADDWGELILPWILRFRRVGIAVVIIAHAGRNGLMRGTSKREDQAHWVIRLKEAPHSAEAGSGARFVSSFTKNRHSPESRCPSLLWQFLPGAQGTVEIECRKHSGYDAFLEMVEDGVDCQKDIADALDVHKATVSKWVKKAKLASKVTSEGNRLVWCG